jgi:hypothetical protein
MAKRFEKIIKIFASQKNNESEKKSFASDGSEDEMVFITEDLFKQALKGLAKKDKAEIPTITV